MSTAETLPTKQKHLIGIGAAIAAGCQPCTAEFASAAREAGACERGARLAIESGLAGREAATESMSTFAKATFAQPEIDASFRAERAALVALVGVAAAVASNTASLVSVRVEAARALGATDDQIRLAAQIARIARRGAEQATESALGAALGDTASGCCSDGRAGGHRGAQPGLAGGCCDRAAENASSARTSHRRAADPGFETVRIAKTDVVCSLCEDYGREHAGKPVVVMSCEGACLRGEIARRAANHLCFALAPEKTVRLCLGGAFTKDGGQRQLVRNAERVVALEGCAIRCASRMMQGHVPELTPEIFVTDGMCEFDRSLFGIETLPSEAVEELGRTVAHRIAERI